MFNYASVLQSYRTCHIWSDKPRPPPSAPSSRTQLDDSSKAKVRPSTLQSKLLKLKSVKGLSCIDALIAPSYVRIQRPHHIFTVWSSYIHFFDPSRLPSIETIDTSWLQLSFGATSVCASLNLCGHLRNPLVTYVRTYVQHWSMTVRSSFPAGGSLLLPFTDIFKTTSKCGIFERLLIHENWITS